MENLAILRDLGLHEHEAAIYITLLKLGPSPAALVAKESSIERTAAYPILKSLARKGFVSLFYKGTRRLYRAQQPQKISNFFEKKVQSFNQIIPSLKALEKKQARVLGLRFIETPAELKLFYADVLTTYRGKQYYIISSANAWEGLDPEFFIQFRKDRGRAKIKTRLLLSAESEQINPIDPALLRQWRYLPPEYNFRSTIDIYPDQILIVSDQLNSLAVVITIPAMVDVFKSIFNLLWDLLSKP